MEHKRQPASLSSDTAGILESTLHSVSDAVGYHEWLASQLADFLIAPVLEVGAGLGGLTRALAQRVSPILASEPDPKLQRHLEDLQLPGVQTAEPLSLPLLDSPSSNVAPHSIVMSNVLEHIYDDQGALRSLHHIAAADRLAIVVPAHRWAYTGLDAELGHYRRYTRATLRSIMTTSGWHVHSVRYFNPVGAFAWAFSGRILGRTTIEPWQTRAVERSLPLLKLVDAALRGTAFGQSVIALATRASD